MHGSLPEPLAAALVATRASLKAWHACPGDRDHSDRHAAADAYGRERRALDKAIDAWLHDNATTPPEGAVLSPGEAVVALVSLGALASTDPEAAHSKADEILLSAAPPEVGLAYRRLVEDARWWAAS